MTPLDPTDAFLAAMNAGMCAWGIQRRSWGWAAFFAVLVVVWILEVVGVRHA